jgi:hypothetical protein
MYSAVNDFPFHISTRMNCSRISKFTQQSLSVYTQGLVKSRAVGVVTPFSLDRVYCHGGSYCFSGNQARHLRKMSISFFPEDVGFIFLRNTRMSPQIAALQTRGFAACQILNSLLCFESEVTSVSCPPCNVDVVLLSH